jgi:hypothetical protein
LFQPEGFTNASLDAVTVHGSSRVSARHQKPESRYAGLATSEKKSVALDAATFAFAQEPLELCLAPQPARPIKAETLLRRGDRNYSASRRRPRARRLRNTARPPCVRLRTRNPWRRARRVLDGW